jgi:hypothetical protein
MIPQSPIVRTRLRGLYRVAPLPACIDLKVRSGVTSKRSKTSFSPPRAKG